jgi:hypothetical protein
MNINKETENDSGPEEEDLTIPTVLTDSLINPLITDMSHQDELNTFIDDHFREKKPKKSKKVYRIGEGNCIGNLFFFWVNRMHAKVKGGKVFE